MSTKTPAWPAEPLADRLDRCRAMLAIHGMLTEKESKACRKRIVASVRGLKKALRELDRATAGEEVR